MLEDDTPRAFGKHFRDFLAGLQPRRICIPCLAQLFDQTEPPVRAALQTLGDKLELQTGECRNCTKTSQTYRIAAPSISS